MAEVNTEIFYLAIIIFASLCMFIAEYLTPKRDVIIITKDCNIQKKHIEKKSFLALIFISLSFIIGTVPLVRRSCGADLLQYYHNYKYIPSDGEPLFYGMCKIMHTYIPSPKYGMGIIGCISLFFVYLAFFIVKDKISLGCCTFAFYTCLYFFMYNYVRMMFASSLIILGYVFIIKDKKSLALCSIVIAIGCHKSAIIVFAACIYLYFFKEHKKLMTLLGGILAIILLANPVKYFSMVNDDRYGAFINSYQMSRASLGIGTLVKILPIILIIILIYSKYKDNNLYYIFVAMTVFNAFFSLLGYFVPVASRLSLMYFVFQYLFFIPWIIKNEKKGEYKILLTIFMCVYCLGLYYLNSKMFVGMGIMPYK